MALSILDSTLREGEQAPGVCFDPHVKLAIAELLDEIGIDIIEVGHPAVSEEISTTITQISNRGLNATLAAHARATRRDIDIALECGVGMIGLFFCVTDSRLKEIFQMSLEEASDSIGFLVSHIKSQASDVLVRFTPEDTVRSSYENVLNVSAAAARAGADIISIADTTGAIVPGTNQSLGYWVSKLKSDLLSLDLKPRIAVHCHNDRGLALANVLEAWQAGAEIIDASVMGLGERAGIVDLAQLLVVISELDNAKSWRLDLLNELYALVALHSGRSIPDSLPVMGEHSFTHCAGVHTHAAIQNPLHYESLSPEIFGRNRQFSLDHMSGKAALRFALSQLHIDETNDDVLSTTLDRIHQIGRKGRTVSLDELALIVSYQHSQLRERVTI